MTQSSSLALDKERLALLRSFIYQKDLFWLLPSVEKEYLKIKKPDRRRKHWLVGIVHFLDVLKIDKTLVTKRIKDFFHYHPREPDCKVLAETEVGGLTHFVTFDADLIKHLKDQTPLVILTPSEYWDSLNVQKGTEPHRVPHESNPMSQSSHWKW